MEGAGLRSAEVVGCRWQDIDLVNGRVVARRKGAHWQWVPLDPTSSKDFASVFGRLGRAR
jgi:site-specific recombinase XerC